MNEIDLTQIDPRTLATAEKEKIKAILPKLAGLKKIIAVTEARAKELLNENEDALDGEWILKEGAMDRRIDDAEGFVELMLAVQDAREDYVFQPTDLLGVAGFPVGKVEKLLMDKLGLPKKMAGDRLEAILGGVLVIKRKAKTLVEGKPK